MLDCLSEEGTEGIFHATAGYELDGEVVGIDGLEVGGGDEDAAEAYACCATPMVILHHRLWLGVGCLGDKAFQSTSEVQNQLKASRVGGKDSRYEDSFQENRRLFYGKGLILVK